MKSKWLTRFWTLVREAFRREDVPAVHGEKKRQYSISGWERGENGRFHRGDAVIYRKGRVWIRNDGYESHAHDVSYPSLHAAIKRELGAMPPLLVSGESVTFPGAPLLGFAEPGEPGGLGEGPLFTAGADVQRDGIEVEMQELAEDGDGEPEGETF